MIKAKAGDAMIIGLSSLNLEKLREGKPIAFDGAECGFPGMRVMILWGETEADIATELLAAASGEGKPS